MGSGETDPIRLQIANVLDEIASQHDWSDELRVRFNELLKLTIVDGLLAHADEELIHFSGEFNARNLLFIRVKPDKEQVSSYQDEFRNIADALRRGMTWEEYKRKNNIYESGELTQAVIGWIRRRFSG